MVILLAGASHTGKTVLAQRLLEKLGYPYLSIDHLKMGLIRSGNTELTPMDDDKLTDYLWPIVREMVKTAIENGQNLIVEGCYIPFDWQKEFAPEYLAQIRYRCLIMSKNYIEAHFHYDLSRTCDEIRPDYYHVESCQETVPEAITAFLEGQSFEDVVRTAVSLGGDCDTLTCISGSMAEAFYGVPEELKDECRKRLPEDLLEVLQQFDAHLRATEG